MPCFESASGTGSGIDPDIFGTYKNVKIFSCSHVMNFSPEGWRLLL
jgi:hypothetical protein